VLGYCIAPLNIAALISSFVRIIYVRAPIALLAWAWCVWGGCRSKRLIMPAHRNRVISVHEFPWWYQNRAAEGAIGCVPTLVSYETHLTWGPLLMLDRLFYFVLAWMILIQ
jgi:hypothetical protein